MMRGMMKVFAKSDEFNQLTEVLNTRMDCMAAHVKKVEHKVDIVATDQITQMRRELDNIKDSGGATPAQTTSSSSSYCIPRTIHFRGWEPFGSPSAHKLTKNESVELQQELDTKIPPEWRTKTRGLAQLMLMRPPQTVIDSPAL